MFHPEHSQTQLSDSARQTSLAGIDFRAMREGKRFGKLESGS